MPIIHPVVMKGEIVAVDPNVRQHAPRPPRLPAPPHPARPPLREANTQCGSTNKRAMRNSCPGNRSK